MPLIPSTIEAEVADVLPQRLTNFRPKVACGIPVLQPYVHTLGIPVCVEVFELRIYSVALRASSVEIAHHYWGNRHHTILYTKTWISVEQGH